MVSFKARVYFNLHKHKISVQKYVEGKGWRLFCHLDYLIMKNCVFKVYESGRKRVFRENRKNVHAYVIGDVNLVERTDIDNNKYYIPREDYEETVLSSNPFHPFTYDPYKFMSFVNERTYKCVNVASCVILDFSSEYGKSLLYSVANIDKVICAKCGEITCGTPEESLYGVVHKYGPLNHFFEPEVISHA